MKQLLIISVLVVTAAGVRAEEIFQASLTPDIALHSRTTQINGFSLNIWGENPQYSFNLGFINGSTGDSKGLSWGLANYADDYTGVAVGVVNMSRERFFGWQNGAINSSQGTFTGLQSGWINLAEDFHGLQLGMVNYAENLRGVQVGLVNIAQNNPWFDAFPDKLATAFPMVNWSF